MGLFLWREMRTGARCAILAAATAGAGLAVSGCATVSLNGAEAEAQAPARAELHQAAARMTTAYAGEGWGGAEEPGMAARLAGILLNGLGEGPGEAATPAETYLAGLPENPSEASASVAEDLVRATALARETGDAGDGALGLATEPGQTSADLSAAEGAAQAALRADAFFATVIEALRPDLQPVERSELERLRQGLGDQARRLADQADAFAERRRDAQGAVS